MKRNYFTIEHTSPAGGRLGTIRVFDETGSETCATTPRVFPVINVMGGPAGPGRNGGLWRPVKWWMFLYEQNSAFLCQVLHALDFKVKGTSWKEWTKQPFKTWIAEWRCQQPEEYADHANPKRHDVGYPFRELMKQWGEWVPAKKGTPHLAPITFLDSGGFTLMKKDAFNKAQKWYDLDTTPEHILKLQTTLGGDLVASLDFPLPPGMPAEIVRQRQEKSIANALELLELMGANDQNRALPYLAVHGINEETAYSYVRELFQGWMRLSDKAKRVPFGIAIGSMVPRADDPRTVIETTWGVMRGLKEAGPILSHYGHGKPPVHMFGITSHLIAFLVYMGVDTFDSQTYADVAQRGGYFDADLRPINIKDVQPADLVECGCPYCSKIWSVELLEDMKGLLKPKQTRDRTSTGVAQYYHLLSSGPDHWVTRSDLYGLLAMHNWHRISRELELVKGAVEQDRLDRHLAKLVKDHDGQRKNRLRDGLYWLARAEESAGRSDTGVQVRLLPVIQTLLDDANPVPTQRRETGGSSSVRIRKRDFTEFSVPNDYAPASHRRTMLLMACSKGKPYGESQHQSHVINLIEASFPPMAAGAVERVTLSGLYGPVPSQYETLEQILDYDFRLELGDDDQASRVTQRLIDFLIKHGHDFDNVVAYVYFPAYRQVVDKAFKEIRRANPEFRGRILPTKPGLGGKASRYRNELLDVLGDCLGVLPQRPPKMVQSHLDLGPR